MNDIHKIDKEVGLIKLTVGQICSAGIIHNIYTGDRKSYSIPFVHKVWIDDITGNHTSVNKNIGLAIRIDNDGFIISNPSYRGNAIIAFLPKEYENTKIHTCQVVKVNKRSVNILPIEYEKTEPSTLK